MIFQHLFKEDLVVVLIVTALFALALIDTDKEKK